VLSKTHALVEHFLYGDFTGDIATAVLRFSGFKVRVSEVGNSEALSEGQKASLLKNIGNLAKKAK
jgi:hypothetical protein